MLPAPDHQSLLLPGGAETAGARILIVDDSEDMRHLMRTLLEKQAYAVFSAENGAEGLTIARRSRPDLILMDVQMPGMDGYEATRRIKTDPDLAAIPVVILTARSETESRLEGFQQGADDFIAKPFDQRELLARVASLLRISAYRRLLAERNRRIETELDMARVLQQKLLPAVVPTVPGLRVEARYIPMDKVGGDFYDFHVESGRLGIFLVDVSGHGIPGAFFSAVAKMAFHYNRHLVNDGVALMRSINEAVLQFSVQSMFLTALYFEVDPVARQARFCLAGQCRPLLFRPDTGEFFELYTRGVPIGILAHMPVEEDRVALYAGDRIILFTDGLVDLNNNLDLFGEEGLKRFLADNAALSTADLADRLLDHVRALTGKETFSDDLTFLIVDVE